MRVWRGVASAAALAAAAAGCDQAQPGEGAPGDARSALVAESDGGLITSIGLVGVDGHPLDAYMANHRAVVTVQLKTVQPIAEHHITIGLIQKSDASTPPDARRTCRIGAWTATYGAGEDGAETTVTLKHDVVIPKECLFQGASSAVANLWAGIDMLMEHEAQLAEEQGEPPPRGDNTQFFDEAGLDLNGQDRNQFCTGPNGEAGCAADYHVIPTKGHNLAVSTFSANSTIGTIDKACSVDNALPFFSVNSELLLDGSPSHDGVTEDEKPYNVLAQISSQPGELYYEICPRALDGAPGSCAPGTSWARLGIKNETGLVAAAQFTEMATDQPNSHSHSLFADPDGAACARINGADPDESWLGHGAYNLRACAKLAITETRNGGGDPLDDNCMAVPVQVMRNDSSGADGEASTFQYSNSYSNTWGNSTASVSLNASRVATANLTGATVQKSVTANLGGNWFSTNILNISASGSSTTSLTGSAAGNFSVFGTSYWSASSSSNNYQWSGGPSFTTSIYCMSYNLGVAGLGFNLSGCLNASAGLTFAYDIRAQNGAGPAPFNTATRNGRTVVNFTPWANVSLVLSASANLALLQGGVTGNLMLVQVSLPINDDMKWGLTSLSGKPTMIVQANTSISVKVDALRGSVGAWVRALEPRWCKGRFFGYPCAEWVTIYNQDIASWNGWTTNLNLYSKSDLAILQ